MSIVLLTLKNKNKLLKLIFIFVLIIINYNFVFSQIKPGTSQSGSNTQVEAMPGRSGSRTQNQQVGTQQRQKPDPYVPKKFPVFIIGPFAGVNFFHISYDTSNTVPEWEGIEFTLGAFFDIRVSKHFAFKVTYEYQLGQNISISADPAKSYNLVNVIARYVLAMKHQLWIGLGLAFHILDSFASTELNNEAYDAGISLDPDTGTEKKVKVFFTLYMGYYLEVSKLIVLDFQFSYGLLHNNISDWRYNSFRINFGVGFRF